MNRVLIDLCHGQAIVPSSKGPKETQSEISVLLLTKHEPSRQLVGMHRSNTSACYGLYLLPCTAAGSVTLCLPIQKLDYQQQNKRKVLHSLLPKYLVKWASNDICVWEWSIIDFLVYPITGQFLRRVLTARSLQCREHSASRADGHLTRQ